MNAARIFYELVPLPGDDEGWHVTRDGHVLHWHADKSDALIEGIAKAIREADAGGRTGLRVRAKDGRVLEERLYPRSGAAL